MYSVKDLRFFTVGVSPFGNPRVKAYFQLTVAYRRLSRPSSALGAKAFTLCSFSLEQPHLLYSLEFFQVRFLFLAWVIANNCFGLQIWKDFKLTLFSAYVFTYAANLFFYPCFHGKTLKFKFNTFFSLQLSVLFVNIRFSMNNLAPI